MAVQMRPDDRDEDRPSVQDRMIEDFDPGPMPAMAPNGAPKLEPVAAYPEHPPRICSVGPCRHYHTFTTQVDAQNPMDVGRHGRAFHHQDHHYCYPGVGIDTELGAMPVLGCNRWSPPFSLIRPKWLLRRRYERELTRWNYQRLDAMDALSLNAPVPLVIVFRFAGEKPADFHYEQYEWDHKPEDALDQVVMHALETVGFVFEHKTGAPAWAVDDKVDQLRTFTWALADEHGNPYDNFSATVGELGLEGGHKLIVTFTDKES